MKPHRGEVWEVRFDPSEGDEMSLVCVRYGDALYALAQATLRIADGVHFLSEHSLSESDARVR